MKAILDLVNADNKPLLIPTFKRPERKLLSVFMSLLELVPEFRGAFFKRCGCGYGKTPKYQSFMEPKYRSSKYSENNPTPDGLVVCQRGNNQWSAFIEAKANNNQVETEQIKKQADLAAMLGVDVLISISNKFTNRPSELPYPMPKLKKSHPKLVHFAWAELENFLKLFLYNFGDNCHDAEKKIIEQCLIYFENSESGVLTYDMMPKGWRAIVESAGTFKGFNTKAEGITEIVHGWQQECRDLHSKIIYEYKNITEFIHETGAKSSQEERMKFDLKMLANERKLVANFGFKQSKANLQIFVKLNEHRIVARLGILPPADKKSRGTLSWIHGQLQSQTKLQKSLKIGFDWKRTGINGLHKYADIMNELEHICKDQKDRPKKIILELEILDVRRFNDRRRVIEDIESLSLSLVKCGAECGFI